MNTPALLKSALLIALLAGSVAFFQREPEDPITPQAEQSPTMLPAMTARETSPPQAAAVKTLFRTAGATAGRPLAPKSSGYIRARLEGLKPEGRVTVLERESFTGIGAIRRGDRVTLPLADGETVSGIANLILNDGGTIRIGGALSGGEVGSFAIHRNGDQVGGLIQRIPQGIAYRIEQGKTGEVLLRELPRSDVVCSPMPRMKNEVPAATGLPQSAPPLLDSRPTAVAQLYLDFDGETVTDPHWDNGNTIVAASFNLSNASITEIFNRVKEDFWPFNINITTDVSKYNSAPVGMRMRCIITPTDTAAPGAGGVAYLTSFDQAGGVFSSTIPCWVFNSGIVGISEAISHEAGHTFNLNHDGRITPAEEYFSGHGSGATSWAPIMGTSYTVNVGQWSKGEYQSANNTEDDVAIISNATNGFGYAADEAGNTIATAAGLNAPGGTVLFSGLITTAADVDFYAFTTTGGTVTISAANAINSPNLDVALEIQNAGGTALVSDNPAALLTASVSTSLAAGTYYLKVSGSGAANPLTTGYTNYGSLGAYALSGTVPGGVGTPPNNQFSGAQSLPGNSGSVAGTNVGGTKETGEPNHAANAGGASVWYQWTASFTGSVTFDTLTSGFDTLLAAYTGSAVNGLTAVPGGANDNDAGSGTLQSKVTFTATSGTVYRIAVDGSAGATGNIVLTYSQVPANNDFANAQILTGASGTVTGANVGTNKQTGEPNHHGNIGGASVWYQWTAPSTGTATIDTLTSNFDTLLAIYTGSAVGSLTLVLNGSNDDDAGSGTLQSKVIINVTSGTIYRIAVDGFNGAVGEITLHYALVAANNPPAGTNVTLTTDEDTAYIFAAANFGFTDPLDVPANTLLAVKITTLPTAGSLTNNAVAVVAGASIPVADITAGLLRFTPAANASGAANASLTFQVQDNGGTANGGIDLDASPNTITVNVTAVNDAPSGADKTITTNEDTAYTFAAADFGLTDPTDTPANTLLAVKVTTLPGSGSLTNNSVAIVAGATIPVANITSGLLRFTPALNANGAALASFTFQVQDNGGTASGGIDLDASPNTITVNVTAVNDAPTGTDKTITTNEDTDYTFAAADFGFSDPIDTPANTLLAVKITTLPASGSLTNNSVAVTAGASITAANIASGLLRFTPALNANGVANSSFTFQVQDSGGTANSGIDLDPSPNTITVNVTAVNDAPALNANAASLAYTENQAATAIDGGLTVSDLDSASLTGATIAITANFASGQDVLAFTNQSGITGSYSAGTGVITLTGTATLAAYQTALRTITYSNSSDNPSTSVRTLTFTANDGAAANNLGATTRTIAITAVNDQPALDPIADPAPIPPNSGQQTVNLTGIATGGGESQVLTVTVSGNTNATLIPSPAITYTSANPTGTLTYTPAANQSGTATLTVQVADNGGVANGGLNTITRSFLVTIGNGAPVVTTTSGSLAYLENQAPTTIDATITVTDFDNANLTSGSVAITGNFATGQDVLAFSNQAGITGSYTAATGVLTLTGTASLAAYTTAFRSITYANTSDAPSTAIRTITFTANDGQAANNLGTNTRTVTVTAVNDAPAGTSATVATNEDSVLTFSAANFGFTDPLDSPANTLLAVKITTLPGVGSLTNNSTAVIAGASISLADITSGNLRFTPVAAANGASYAAITFQVQDNGGTANSGTDLDPTPNTLTVDVVSINDAPAGADKTVTTNEDAAYIFTIADFALTDPNDAPANALLAVKITTLPGAGSLANNGVAIIAGADVSVANIAAGLLRFTPTANTSGTPFAGFTFQVRDDGGTASGGIDLDPTANAITVNVAAVNDAPSFTKGANQTLLEDAATQTLAGWASALSQGPADEVGQTLDFIVSNDNAALFSAQPAVAANGTLTYTPAPNANGSAIVTVQIHDNGGIANGGIDTSAAQTFTITVAAVNDAPSFTKGANQSVDEDATAQTFAGWATALSKGPADEAAQVLDFIVSNDNTALFSSQPVVAANGTLTYTPAANANGSAVVTVQIHDNGGIANGGVDTSAAQTFTITVAAVNDTPSFTKGANQTVPEDATAQTLAGWASAFSRGPADEAAQVLDFIVSNDNAALFSAQPAVAANGTLTYTPAANANGSAVVTVQIHDNGGIANGGVDTSAAQTFTITVTPVNDAPSFTKGANQTVPEDATAQTLADWATALSKGPPDEATQVLDFIVSNDNTALFSAQPAVAANGTLTFTPMANKSGSAIVTVSVYDDGGVAIGGVDTSATQTFTITVTTVNDAPAFTKGADAESNEDAGPQTLAAWASSISAGATDEATQVLDFIVSNDNLALFATAPAVDATGTLTYTAAANISGSATVTLTLHDNGGTADNGVDESAAQTFTITIQPVNDAPSFIVGADQTPLQNAGAQSIAGWATAISPGPAGEAAQTLDFLVSNDNAALFLVPPAISPNGTLTFTPAGNTSGAAIVTVRLHDNGGTDLGGVDTSAAQTFTITTTPVNDAPTFTKGANQSVAQDGTAQTLVGWATAISPGPADEGSQLLNFLVTVDQPALFATQPTIAPNGTLTFAPAPTASGTAIITVRIHDDGGTANGGIDTSAAQTFSIAVTTFAEELGAYNGLAKPAGTPSAARTGSVKVTIGKAAAFTAKLVLGGKSFSMKGKFDKGGAAHFGKTLTPTIALKRKNLPDLVATLQLDVSGSTDFLTGTITENAAAFAVLSADRALYTSKKNPIAPLRNVPALLLGKYTVLFVAKSPAAQSLASTAFPQGDGIGTLTVSASGFAKLKGSLADGSGISCSAPLSKANAWPFYVSLAKGQGGISGPTLFRDEPGVSVLDAQNIVWLKPASTAVRYPAGWPTGIRTDLIGSKYVAPLAAANASALPGLAAEDADGNATITLTEGGILAPGLTQAANISAKNKVTMITPVAAKLALSISVKAGTTAGSFIHPVTLKKLSPKGVIFQKQQLSSGYFLGATESGLLDIRPATPTP